MQVRKQMTSKSVLALLGLLTLSTACGTSPTASASPPASVSSTPPSTLPQISPGPWPRQTSLAYDSTTKEIVLFGGFPYDGNPPYDTWTWSGHQWTLHPKADVSSPARTRYGNAPGRAGAALADDPDHGVVVMFGGGDRSDTWLWDGTGWTQAQPVHSPWQRTGAAFVWDPVRHVDLLFGGQGGNDTWSWNGTTGLSSRRPTPRLLATTPEWLSMPPGEKPCCSGTAVTQAGTTRGLGTGRRGLSSTPPPSHPA